MVTSTPVIPIFSVGDYDAQVRRGAEVLREGGLLVLPTETVYGAAGLLTRPDARQRLHGLRGDPDGKPFTIHLARPADARRYLGPVSELGQRLMKKLWPGPVSLVFDVPAERRAAVSAELGLAESELYDNGGITLRCPDHILAADVIGQVEGPVVLMVPPAAAGQSGSGEQIAKALANAPANAPDGQVDLIFDAGPTAYSKPSTMLKVSGEKYEVVREGVFDQRIIEKLLKTTILFVCSGNTCRSPMAEAIARHLLAEKEGVPEPELERKGISVVSAGAFATPGSRAAPQAVDAVKALGADLSTHRSRPLTIELIHQADVIYTMARGHAQAVTAMVPSASQKVVTLDPSGDIDDPIGGDIALYQDVAGQLRTLIEKRLGEMNG